MKEVVIQAASYLGNAGHGNDRTGLRPWPASVQRAFAQGGLAGVDWSSLFNCEPARFGRMDLMCRLGVLAVDLLQAGLDTLPLETQCSTGVCVETFAGSLETDLRFLKTPRPSLFTYTLPSTVLGELCIRYHFTGPVLCLVASEHSAPGALIQGVEWVQQGQASVCLCLRCEALDRDVADASALPNSLRPSGSYAAALLLGEKRGAIREYPLTSEPLNEICQGLCGIPATDQRPSVLWKHSSKN